MYFGAGPPDTYVAPSRRTSLCLASCPLHSLLTHSGTGSDLLQYMEYRG